MELQIRNGNGNSNSTLIANKGRRPRLNNPGAQLALNSILRIKICTRRVEIEIHAWQSTVGGQRNAIV